MPLTVTLKRDDPFVLNGATLVLPAARVSHASRLGIMDAAQLSRHGRVKNLVASHGPIWIEYEPYEVFVLNGAVTSFRDGVTKVRLSLYNQCQLVTMQHKVSGLRPDTPSYRLYAAVWAMAITPRVGPRASADRLVRAEQAYAQAVSHCQSVTGERPLAEAVDEFVRRGDFNRALRTFRTVCPGGKQQAGAAPGADAAEPG